MTAPPAGARPSAGIGRRIAGYAIDQLPVLAGGAVVVALALGEPADGSIDGALLQLSAWSGLALVYALVLWWWLATAGFTPGKRLLGMRVVSEATGRPIGWGPAFLRQLVLGLVTACTLGLGAVVLAAVAARDPRRRGWHDRAAGSVVLDQRAAPEAPPAARRAPRTAPGIVPVALPAGVTPPRRPEPSAPLAAPQPPVPPAAPAVVPRPIAPPPPAAPSGPISAVPGLVDDVPGIHPPSSPLPGDPPDEDDVELTRMPRRATAGGWALLVAGRRAAVHGPGLLGRDPQPRPGEDTAQLVPVDDPHRSLSKTHLAFGIDDDGFWICDRGSTNGTVVRAPDGTRRDCPPDTPVRVPPGSVLLVGDHEVTVSGPLIATTGSGNGEYSPSTP
jgi:uncharacterized RDD family membrane protein YckC